MVFRHVWASSHYQELPSFIEIESIKISEVSLQMSFLTKRLRYFTKISGKFSIETVIFIFIYVFFNSGVLNLSHSIILLN